MQGVRMTHLFRMSGEQRLKKKKKPEQELYFVTKL